ncbi:MAG: helix-turn-helix domain-containing protein [Bacilli bacterium]|nr:helix-turn-helix domain-containing protein [Bacilli bacterium]
MDLGSKITKLRKRKGYSQEQLAQKMGVSRQSVFKWESGENTPDIDKIKRLTEIFGVTFDDLLNDEIDIDNQKETHTPDAPTKTKTKDKIVLGILAGVVGVAACVTVPSAVIILRQNAKNSEASSEKSETISLFSSEESAESLPTSSELSEETLSSSEESFSSMEESDEGSSFSSESEPDSSKEKEESDRARANYVIELINNLGEITEESGDALREIELAYADLTSDQKDLVTNYSVYLIAKERYESLLLPSRKITLADIHGSWRSTIGVWKIADHGEFESVLYSFFSTQTFSWATGYYESEGSSLVGFNETTKRMDIRLSVGYQNPATFYEISAYKSELGEITLIFGELIFNKIGE